MLNVQTRFRVRESAISDPGWDATKAVSLWERMLTTHLQALAAPNNVTRPHLENESSPQFD